MSRYQWIRDLDQVLCDNRRDHEPHNWEQELDELPRYQVQVYCPGRLRIESSADVEAYLNG